MSEDALNTIITAKSKKEAMQAAIYIIERNIEAAAERHYSEIIFKPDYPSQSTYEKYAATYCKWEIETIKTLERMIDEIITE